MERKRRGRPTDNPKPYQLSVKYGEDCMRILTAYCDQEHVTRMEAVRRGMKKLEGDLKR